VIAGIADSFSDSVTQKVCRSWTWHEPNYVVAAWHLDPACVNMMTTQ